MSKVYATSYRDLIVYQKARALQREIFLISKKFPREETYALTDQRRRSARSIGANLAEAWAKRRYPAHFLSKLTDAEGELFETHHWIETALDCEYIDAQTAQHLVAQCQEIGRMLGSMMSNAELFSGDEYKRARESAAEYFVNTEH